MRNQRTIQSVILTGILSVACLVTLWPVNVQAKESTNTITGQYFEFEKESKYEIDGTEASSSIEKSSDYGTFAISGDVKSTSHKNGFTAYEVEDNNVTLSYTLGNKYNTAESTSWHIEEDKSKTVNGEKLDKNILSGAIIVQSSLDGENWITDSSYTDIANSESDFEKEFYTTNDIQQVNGCYYRVIVVYELEKQVEDKKIAFAKLDSFEYKKCAEVYQFYLVSEVKGNTNTAQTTPRKELGKKVNTGKDKGYSGSTTITQKDPHYGWDLGVFTINGYTRETSVHEEGKDKDVYLKNVGDKVTLWFTLNQDIASLNGNSKLQINEDKDGWDQEFEVAKTNFKCGTLIIRYTDYEGVVHNPVIYTDYLAANTRTGADTKVELFEEGDYEVALDYEIVDKNGVIDSVSDYRIAFDFSIRNGNCMVYPFDAVSGAELSDGSITENGFKLDMAKSRYLTIDVKKTSVKSADGIYTEDERFNRPAKDGEIYTEEGVYTFTVKNLYTDSESTTKTIYVGSNPIMKAMASTGKSVSEINQLISDGAVLSDDGTISFPATNEVVEKIIPEEIEEVVEEVQETRDEEPVPETENIEEPERNNVVNNESMLVPIVIVIVVIALFVFIALSMSNTKKAAEMVKAQQAATKNKMKEIGEEKNQELHKDENVSNAQSEEEKK